MIISDLALLETVEANNVVGGSSFSKDVKFNTKVNQKFDVDIMVKAKKDIESKINAKTDVKGYSAVNVYENTAEGNNAYAQSDVTNFVSQTYGLAEASGTLIAAANK
jgi:hypothetical protein